MPSLRDILLDPRRSRAVLALVVALMAARVMTSPAVVLAQDEVPAYADATIQRSLFLPMASRAGEPPVPGRLYETIPVDQPSPDGRSAAAHGDLNLALRGYVATSAPLALVSYSGSTDPRAPQLAGIFTDKRVPEFTSVHRVYNWDWSCSADGCRGTLISNPPVTLLGMRTQSGELLSVPSRSDEIYGGGYRAMVLYAEATRITLVYTRNDHVVDGYTVHLEGISVDSGLLSLYQQANAAGRSALPALRNDQPLGAASGSEIKVAIRDRGTFLDPRSRKDWWQGY